MSFLSDLFTSGADKLVGTVGGVLDELITSDEEKIKLGNALKVAIMEHERTMQSHIAAYDKEITTRHANDMKSDSWLSKNVRPLVLVFLTVNTMILAYLTIFALPTEKVVLLTPWLALLQILLVTVYAFYFGSRGIEKVTKMRKDQ